MLSTLRRRELDPSGRAARRCCGDGGVADHPASDGHDRQQVQAPAVGHGSGRVDRWRAFRLRCCFDGVGASARHKSRRLRYERPAVLHRCPSGMVVGLSEVPDRRRSLSRGEPAAAAISPNSGEQIGEFRGTRPPNSAEHPVVELGGIEPPSARWLPNLLRPFPTLPLNSCGTGGSADLRQLPGLSPTSAVFHAVSGLSLRSIPTSVAGL